MLLRTLNCGPGDVGDGSGRARGANLNNCFVDYFVVRDSLETSIEEEQGKEVEVYDT